MTSKEFRNEIYVKRPRYEDSKRETLEQLSKKGSKKGEFLMFGPFYEIYMYAFFIGYNRNERLPLLESSKKDQFREIGQWKPEGIVDYILMLLFGDKTIINYSWDELEDLSSEELGIIISNIIKAIEEYANAGLAFLKEKIEKDKTEFTDPFVFVNILNEVINKNAEKEKYSDFDNKKNIAETKDELRIQTLIKNGESSIVEFKSTLRYCMNQKKDDKKMEYACMKTIAAYLNSEGGTLLIGIDDNGNILGLDNDFSTFTKPNKMDEFQKHLDNLIQNYFNNSIFGLLKINFHDLSKSTICEIIVKQSDEKPIMLKNVTDMNIEEFYIRRSASSKALSRTEMIEYISTHWKKQG